MHEGVVDVCRIISRGRLGWKGASFFMPTPVPVHALTRLKCPFHNVSTGGAEIFQCNLIYGSSEHETTTMMM
jgi:hypothetical protein